jgi:hypothetical protein
MKLLQTNPSPEKNWEKFKTRNKSCSTALKSPKVVMVVVPGARRGGRER